MRATRIERPSRLDAGSDYVESMLPTRPRTVMSQVNDLRDQNTDARATTADDCVEPLRPDASVVNVAMSVAL